MESNQINIDDIVFCVESGVRGKVLKFYTPTACEMQIMVETDDGYGQYHAPISTWRLYQPEKLTMMCQSGIEFADNPITKDNGEILNKHGKYVTIFARNHGISVAETHICEMWQKYLNSK